MPPNEHLNPVPINPSTPVSPVPVSAPVGPQLPPQNKTRKTTILIAAIAAAVLVFLLAGVGLWAKSSADSYKKGAANYETKVAAAYKYYHDSKNVDEHVADITKHFEDALAAKPHESSFLGKSLTKSDDKKRVDELTEALVNLRDGFVNLHQFSKYAEQVLSIMDRSTVDIAAPGDMKPAKIAFTKAIADLKALQVPKGSETFQATKIKAYEKLVADTDAVTKAFDDIDLAAFNTALATLSKDSHAADVGQAASELATKYHDDYYTPLLNAFNKVADLTHQER